MYKLSSYLTTFFRLQAFCGVRWYMKLIMQNLIADVLAETWICFIWAQVYKITADLPCLVNVLRRTPLCSYHRNSFKQAMQKSLKFGQWSAVFLEECNSDCFSMDSCFLRQCVVVLHDTLIVCRLENTRKWAELTPSYSHVSIACSDLVSTCTLNAFKTADYRCPRCFFFFFFFCQ